MELKIITAIVIIAIGIFQLKFLITGLTRISQFKNIFSSHKSIKKITLYIPENDLMSCSGEDILANWSKYTIRPNVTDAIDSDKESDKIEPATIISDETEEDYIAEFSESFSSDKD